MTVKKNIKNKSRVASIKRLKKSPKYKSATLVVLLIAVVALGYFVISSFAATPSPPKNVLADRFCGTWLVKQVDTNSQLNNIATTVKHGLEYDNMRGFSLRTNWSSIDNNGTFNPTILDWGKNLVAAYPTQSYSIRAIAGSKSPARLFSMTDMYWYRETASSPKIPLPYNPNSATFAPNTGFEREYTILVNNLVDYAVANNIKLVHMPWYGRDWAELNYHPEITNEPNFSKDKWVTGHKRLTDIVYNKVKDYPDISVEFPLSGWNNLGDGPSATNELTGYLVDATAHPLWANFSGRLFVQGNGYGLYSGLDGKIGSPTSRPIYRGMQMYDQFDKYSSLWQQMYSNLGKDPLYATYLEVYAENFGYESSNPANHTNLQAGITQFATTKCASAPSDNAAPQINLTTPESGSTVADPTNITASATDDIGVTKVEFYIDNALVVTDTTAPYTYTWSTANISPGSHTVFAKAYDASGKSSASSVVTVSKPAPNQPPTVSIDSPSGGASYNAPATIGITANANDSDGQISKVDFYNGSTMIGSSNASPYKFNWASVGAGTYNLSAKAYDNTGAVANSTPVSVSVNNVVASLSPPTNLVLSLSWDWSKWKNFIITSWQPPADTTGLGGYNVKVTAYDSFKESATLDASTKTYNIYGLYPGAKYTVTVSSVGKDGSTQSNTEVKKSATYACFMVCWLAQ